MKPHLLYPLSEFYQQLGRPLPEARTLQPEEMPETHRRLLVHERDMTPTLEAAHGQSLHVQALKRSHRDDSYSRLVLLKLDDGSTAAMGAISINLAVLPENTRQLVLEDERPFGSILATCHIAHYCCPAAYFEIKADAPIVEALGVDVECPLYGRRNVIRGSSGAELAHVLEILPKTAPPRDPFA